MEIIKHFYSISFVLYYRNIGTYVMKMRTKTRKQKSHLIFSNGNLMNFISLIKFNHIKFMETIQSLPYRWPRINKTIDFMFGERCFNDTIQWLSIDRRFFPSKIGLRVSWFLSNENELDEVMSFSGIMNHRVERKYVKVLRVFSSKIPFKNELYWTFWIFVTAPGKYSTSFETSPNILLKVPITILEIFSWNHWTVLKLIKMHYIFVPNVLKLIIYCLV